MRRHHQLRRLSSAELLNADVPVNQIDLGVAIADAWQDEINSRIDSIQDSIRNDADVTVVHLHGLITSTGEHETSEHHRGIQPVITEGDYVSTEESSAKALHQLFAARNVLILGASISDPPLIRALLSTKVDDESGASVKSVVRFVFHPLQGFRPLAGDASLDEALLLVHASRLEHLGLELITPDFFIQVPQLLEEVRHSLALQESDSREPYSSPTAIHRYGRRLVDWWYQWLFNGLPLPHRQVSAHKYLERKLNTVRRVLSAPETEPLKIEIWIRWSPENTRQLALWASSVGAWSDPETMRKGKIRPDTPYVAVKAFMNGSPTFMSATEGRWKSYLAAPIWYLHTYSDDDESFTETEEFTPAGSIPIGVILMASMWDQAESAISPRRRRRTAQALNVLDHVAQNLVKPR